jgi:hypothetical protein
VALIVAKERFFYQAWAGLDASVRDGRARIPPWRERLVGDPAAPSTSCALDDLATRFGGELPALTASHHPAERRLGSGMADRSRSPAGSGPVIAVGPAQAGRLGQRGGLGDAGGAVGALGGRRRVGDLDAGQLASRVQVQRPAEVGGRLQQAVLVAFGVDAGHGGYRCGREPGLGQGRLDKLDDLAGGHAAAAAHPDGQR